MLVAATVLATVLAVAVGAVFAMRLASHQHQAGDAVRWDLWRSAADMLRDHPLVGVGPSAFGTALRLYRNPLLARDRAGTAHNLYLHTGAEMGLLGLVVGCWLLFTLTWTWWRLWKVETPGTSSWWRLLGIGGALAGLAAQSMVETYKQVAILVVVILFMAQMLARDRTYRVLLARPKQWPWIAALAILALGTLGMAWDYWGYAHFLRSVASTKRGDIDKALSAVERARSHDPWMPPYSCHAGYLYGLQAAEDDYEALSAAMERYQQCIAEVPAPGWVDQLNRAALFWQAGQRTEARAVARETTSQTPLEWMPWLNRGLWAEMQGDRKEAVSSYGWVLSLDPELAGSPFWRQGKRADWWDEIVVAGQQARTERAKGYRSWQWHLAVAAGEWETAVQEIEAWLDDHPGDAWAMAWLGEALLGQGRPEEAILWLDRAIAKVPSDARMHIVRGQTLLALGRYEEAEQDLRTALFLEPSHRVHLGLARLAHGVGEEEVALQEYSQALRPLAIAQQSDQVLYHRLSRPALLPQVVWIGYRQDVEAALEWGALLEQRGDSDTAQQVYAAALRLDPFLDQVR